VASPLPSSAVALAERQHGAVARVQLLDHMTAGSVEGLVARRTLVPIERGVYRVAGSARGPRQRAMAAALRARPRARLTGPFVLGLHDIDPFTDEAPFVVLTQPGRRLTNVGFPHRSADAWEPVTWCGAIPCVPLPAALVEAAHPWWEVSDRDLRVGIDHARWRGGLSTAALARTVERAVGHEGALRLVRLIDDGSLTAESEGERSLAALVDGVLPAPVRQAWVDDRYRVDLYWPHLGLAVEYDGRVDHSSAEDRAHDRNRDRDLAGLGIEVLRVSASDLHQPETVRRSITERLLAHAARRLS
jgi:very-short-patch-repair endonuclease